jgi:hypothetical protein
MKDFVVTIKIKYFSATVIERGLEPVDVITDLRTRLNWW